MSSNEGGGQGGNADVLRPMAEPDEEEETSTQPADKEEESSLQLDRTQRLTRADVEKHNSNASAWIIINDKVYDVTKFLEQHPGGEDVLLEQAGGDGSESFDSVGHSSDAREMTEEYCIGELDEDEKGKSTAAPKEHKEKKENFWAIISSPTWTNWIIPAAIALAVGVAYKLLFSSTSKN